MSHDHNDDEMLPEYDMSEAVRGKFYAHGLRFAGITTAHGPITLNAVSTGELTTAKLVIHVSDVHVRPRSARVIANAPEVPTANAPEALSRSA